MLLRPRFRQWRRARPFWGALLTVLAGVELFLSGRFDLAVGGVVLQLGFAGAQTTIIPVVVVLAGVLAMLQPAHHVFYGVIALVLSVYSVVAVNMGGIVLGTLLGVVGSITVVSWIQRPAQAPPVAPRPPAERPEHRSRAAVERLRAVLAGLARRDRVGRQSTASVLSLVLAVGALPVVAPADAAGGVPAGGPCLFGFILCDIWPSRPPAPAPSPSPTAADVPSSPAQPPGPAEPAEPSGETPAGPGGEGPDGEPPTDAGVTVEVPAGLPAPGDEDLPVVLGGNENVDVYAIPAELKAADLEIGGIRAVALVSVPVEGSSGKRRAAVKVVADHVKVSGFRLTTYADGGAAGTLTTADSVTMDGRATMYITSLTAHGPSGTPFGFLADDAPQTLTALVLAAVNPTIGLLGARSDRQVWSGFHESVWAG
ncbi:hypothetical protein ET495_15240 [Xylanimonas allomyrinae]|uniref:Uncharacterized protein n=1 Tax=Xylanimonas allomyrinae TaxID=2509459 RepID=A0A4P6EPE2_9MICO|nr:DUF6114 domain-containing protein [Xylanimonas allomyrinae]QAY64336.1 hypothetical protein ET495_15240 [Xylanimonas allomyrinae]